MSDVMMSEFAAGRHTPQNAFSHFSGSSEDLEEYCSRAIANGLAKPGYTDGVLEVPITSEVAPLFRVGYVELTDRFISAHPEVISSLELTYDRRVGAARSEQRFLHAVARCKKPVATGGILVLYSAELLLREEPEPLVSPPGVTHQIISINATLEGQEDTAGMPLGAMYRNSRGLDGGTKAEFSAEQWEAAAGRALTCVNICEPE